MSPAGARSPVEPLVLVGSPSPIAPPPLLSPPPPGPLTQLAGLEEHNPGLGWGEGGAARNPRAKPVSRDGRMGASPPAPHSSTTSSPLRGQQALAPQNPGPWWLRGEICLGLLPGALGSRGKSGQFFEGGRGRAAGSGGRWPRAESLPPRHASPRPSPPGRVLRTHRQRRPSPPAPRSPRLGSL